MDFHICRYCMNANEFGFTISLSFSLSCFTRLLSGAQGRVFSSPNPHLCSMSSPEGLTELRSARVYSVFAGIWSQLCVCVCACVYGHVDLCGISTLYLCSCKTLSISRNKGQWIYFWQIYIIVFLEWPKATPWTHSSLPLYSHMNAPFAKV